MSKVEIIERRIQTYQVELQKLKLQLRIAKLDQPAGQKQTETNQGATNEKR